MSSRFETTCSHWTHDFPSTPHPFPASRSEPRLRRRATMPNPPRCETSFSPPRLIGRSLSGHPRFPRFHVLRVGFVAAIGSFLPRNGVHNRGSVASGESRDFRRGHRGKLPPDLESAAGPGGGITAVLRCRCLSSR